MRRILLLLLLFGPAGLVVALLLGAIPLPGLLRRLLLLGGAGLLGSLFAGALAGNLGLRATGPEDPTPAFAAAGATAVAGLLATAVAMAVVALRAARRVPRPAPAPATPATPTIPTTTGTPPLVVVRGVSPDEGRRLEEFLQSLAPLVGDRLVVVVSRGKPWGRRLPGGVLLRVPRPREDLITAALDIALQGGGSPAGSATGFGEGGRPSRPRQEGRTEQAGDRPRRPRPEDLAAAMGGGHEGQGEG